MPAVKVIVHPALADVALDATIVWAAFTLRLQHWPNGQEVRVVVLPDDHPVHRAFLHRQLGTHSYVLRQLWDALAATERRRLPVTVTDVEAMRQAVQTTPGAIGYVPVDGPKPRG